MSGAKPTMKKWSAREGDEIDGLLAEVGVELPGEEVSITEGEIKTRKRHKSDDQMDPVWASGAQQGVHVMTW